MSPSPHAKRMLYEFNLQYERRDRILRYWKKLAWPIALALVFGAWYLEWKFRDAHYRAAIEEWKNQPKPARIAPAHSFAIDCEERLRVCRGRARMEKVIAK